MNNVINLSNLTTVKSEVELSNGCSLIRQFQCRAEANCRMGGDPQKLEFLLCSRLAGLDSVLDWAETS